MDLNKIKKLLDFMEEHNLQEVEIKGLFYHVKLKKNSGSDSPTVNLQTNLNTSPISTPVQTQPTTDTKVRKEEENYYAIRSPMVGTFYRSPSPGADPYVKEGDIIKKGQVLCIIEAMKVMNEIESDVSGKVVKILVENGQPVEYNQSLFLVDTNL